MDGTRFDTLARGLSARDTRRGVVKGLAVAGLGLGLLRLDRADAKKKRKKKGHKQLTERCKQSYECKGDAVCKVANSQHYYEATEKRCCIELGDPCDQGYKCCGIDVICNGGYCQCA